MLKKNQTHAFPNKSLFTALKICFFGPSSSETASCQNFSRDKKKGIAKYPKKWEL